MLMVAEPRSWFDFRAKQIDTRPPLNKLGDSLSGDFRALAVEHPPGRGAAL